MKAEKSRELFTVVEIFAVPNYGKVELVKGDINDVVIPMRSPLDKYKGSCYRCCFHHFWGCGRPLYLPNCIDDIVVSDVKFYSRKTAENIQK